jgi:23S rRNA (cytidine2498-2'-O)-methyltransferase
MANVDIVEVMPSSAYRKLLEAFECLRALPPKATHPRDNVPPVVDLGASPGGWTKALRLLGCKVIAVDRSELKEELMTDDFVEFIKGDAFRYEPPWAGEAAPGGTWMVLDVIAYPERVAEILDRWCGGRWADHMVVTVKFQGEAIPWDALDAVIAVVTAHGYTCRVKHFFNNKNEVTLMVVAEEAAVGRAEDEGFLGTRMYPVALPLS